MYENNIPGTVNLVAQESDPIRRAQGRGQEAQAVNSPSGRRTPRGETVAAVCYQLQSIGG